MYCGEVKAAAESMCQTLCIYYIMLAVVKSTQYQLLFPTLSYLIQQISDKKVSFFAVFATWIAECDFVIIPS